MFYFFSQEVHSLLIAKHNNARKMGKNRTSTKTKKYTQKNYILIN
jgi:hypothetical protein